MGHKTWSIHLPVHLTKLGGYLFYRVMKVGKDERFEKVKGSSNCLLIFSARPKIFFIYWTMQAIWILITALPIYILNTNAEDPVPLNW